MRWFIASVGRLLKCALCQAMISSFQRANVRPSEWTSVGQGLVGHVDDELLDPLGGEVGVRVCIELADGFFGVSGRGTSKTQLKRSIDGTDHNISREHLHCHLGESSVQLRLAKCEVQWLNPSPVREGDHLCTWNRLDDVGRVVAIRDHHDGTNANRHTNGRPSRSRE